MPAFLVCPSSRSKAAAFPRKLQTEHPWNESLGRPSIIIKVVNFAMSTVKTISEHTLYWEAYLVRYSYRHIYGKKILSKQRQAFSVVMSKPYKAIIYASIFQKAFDKTDLRLQNSTHPRSANLQHFYRGNWWRLSRSMKLITKYTSLES